MKTRDKKILSSVLTVTSFLLFILLLVQQLVLAKRNSYKIDFASFYAAGRIVRDQKGDNLYFLNTQKNYQEGIGAVFLTDILPFRNPPVVALFFAPFTYLPLVQAYQLFTLINVLLLGLAVYFFSKDMFIKSVGFIATVLILFRPIFFTIQLGQLSIFYLALFGIMFHLLKNKKYLLLGIASGVLVTKPQFLLAVPFLVLLAEDKKSFLTGLIGSLFGFVIANLLISGIGGLIMYPKFVAITETVQFSSYPWRMYSVYPLLVEMFKDFPKPEFTALALSMSLYIAFLVDFARSKKYLNLIEAFSFILITVLVFSPHTLTHDLSLLLLPIFGFVSLSEGAKKKKAQYLAIAFALFMFSFLSYFAVVHWFSLILIGIALLILTFK